MNNMGILRLIHISMNQFLDQDLSKHLNQDLNQGLNQDFGFGGLFIQTMK